MGRIFEKRKYKMFARYDRMAKAFSKIGREIAIAVRQGGADANYNPRLRVAIQNAKGVNMPKDRIDAAIKRASSKDTAGFEEVLYEGYAPHGIALVVECATDNPTRTVAEVRHIFSEHNGSMGTSGSVMFQFERKGVFTIAAAQVKDRDAFELQLIDRGLEDFEVADSNLIAYSSFADFGRFQKALEELKVEATSAELQYLPANSGPTIL